MVCTIPTNDYFDRLYLVSVTDDDYLVVVVLVVAAAVAAAVVVASVVLEDFVMEADDSCWCRW